MAEKKGKVLLAIDYATNWYERFKGCKLANGEPIIVEQTRWKYMNLESCSNEGVVVWCQKNEDPFPFTSQKNDRAVKPDFILIRNFPTALRANDFKSILLGLMFANVPAINNLHSVFMCMHRPLVYSELNRIKLEVFKDAQSVVVEKPSDESNIKKHNAQPARKDVPAVVLGGEENSDQERSKLDKFPLIPMRYYPNQSEDFMPPVMKSGIEFPAVVKVGTAHAGYGKMFLKNKSDFDDLKSVVMMSKDYYTAEPLVKFEYEYRVQKLGDKYRTFRRTSDNAWKSNWGDLKYEEIPIKEYQKKWIDECAKMYGGLDMCAIDVLRTADGEDIILELNDTACGLPYEFEPQDSVHIRDMVLARMNQLFCP